MQEPLGLDQILNERDKLYNPFNGENYLSMEELPKEVIILVIISLSF